MVYYGSSTDRFLGDETDHAEAKKSLHGQVPELVRLYLIAVQSQLELVQQQVTQAIDDLSRGGDSRDITEAITKAAENAIPSLDDILHGDHLAEFVGEELEARTLYELQPISEVVSELSGKVYRL